MSDELAFAVRVVAVARAREPEPQFIIGMAAQRGIKAAFFLQHAPAHHDGVGREKTALQQGGEDISGQLPRLLGDPELFRQRLAGRARGDDIAIRPTQIG